MYEWILNCMLRFTVYIPWIYLMGWFWLPGFILGRQHSLGTMNLTGASMGLLDLSSSLVGFSPSGIFLARVPGGVSKTGQQCHDCDCPPPVTVTLVCDCDGSLPGTVTLVCDCYCNDSRYCNGPRDLTTTCWTVSGVRPSSRRTYIWKWKTNQIFSRKGRVFCC